MAAETAALTSTAPSGDEIDRLLDPARYRLSDRPTGGDTPRSVWKRRIGATLGILVPIAIELLPRPAGLSAAGQASVAAFAFALIWWITEPVATYVTSLVVLVLLVFLGAGSKERVLGVLGMDVIWLNVMAFVLSSIMVKTNVGRRIALFFIVRLGRAPLKALLAFVLLQLALAPLIPATAPRTILTLPLMLIVASAYGSPPESPTNFGRNLFLQNLMGISIGSSAFMTGSAANLIAIGFIQKLSGQRIYYSDWMIANLPIVVLTLAAAWWIGPKWLHPLPPGERELKVPGGIQALSDYRKKMGPLTGPEIRGSVIFGLVVLLWVTDRFHRQWFGFEIDPVFAAMIGAILAFLPRIGVLRWNEADIPWQLMIFSCGAYASGLALEETGAARWAVQRIFDAFHLHRGLGFWPVYAIVVAVMMYSHLLFASKTMRTIILIPFIITLAQQLGFRAASLALPAAFTIDWVVGLPISGKPNVILFGTGEYSVLDNFRYGIVVCTIGFALLMIAGLTWFRFLGITPGN